MISFRRTQQCGNTFDLHPQLIHKQSFRRTQQCGNISFNRFFAFSSSVSEELSSVETLWIPTSLAKLPLVFQKNLVVWKRIYYYPYPRFCNRFQKNLVVWKLMCCTFSMYIFIKVSEELSSVETVLFHSLSFLNLQRFRRTQQCGNPR